MQENQAGKDTNTFIDVTVALNEKLIEDKRIAKTQHNF